MLCDKPVLYRVLPTGTLQEQVVLQWYHCCLCPLCCWLPEAQSCTCVPSGIFQEIVVSRKGAYSCPLASGVVFAVNVSVLGDAGASLPAYSQALLASMQARQPNRQTARSMQWRLRSMPAKQMYLLCAIMYGLLT